MDDAKRTPSQSPSVNSQGSPPRLSPIGDASDSQSGGPQQPQGIGGVLPETTSSSTILDSAASAAIDTSDDDNNKKKKPSATHARTASGSPGVHDLTDDCDIPETIAEVPEEEEDDDNDEEEEGVGGDSNNVGRGNGVDDEPPVLLQPLLWSGDDVPAGLTTKRDAPRGFRLEPRTHEETAGSGSESKSSNSPLPPLAPAQQQRPRALTLESLASHTPFEDEAEGYLLNSLDETNPTLRLQLQATKSTPSKQSLFSDEAMSMSTYRSNRRRNRLTLNSIPAADVRLTSTAENLYELTKAMQSLDYGNNKEAPAAAAGGDPTEAMDGGMSLALNAAGILKHRKKSMDDTNSQAEPPAGEVGSVAAPPEEAGLTLAERMARLAQLTVSHASNETSNNGDAAKSTRRSTILRPSIVSRVPGGEGGDNGLARAASKSSMSVSSSSDSNESSDSSDEGQALTRTERMNKVAAKSEFQRFEDWFRFKRLGLFTFFKYATLFSMLPSIVVASILFYAVGNPPCHINLQCSPKDTDDPTLDYLGSASASWWLLFIFCRQVVTFTLGYATEDLVVDYFALRTGWSVRLFGPLVTLFIVQSNGWPCVIFFWGVFDLMSLFGQHAFAQHWLFYQDFISLMNGQNPSGNIPNSSQYKFIIITAMVVSAVVAIKRMWLSFALGRVTFKRYSEDLARVMAQAILVGKVAALARDIVRSHLSFDNLGLPRGSADYELSDDENSPSNPAPAGRAVLKPNMFAGVDESGVKLQIDALLGEWEEPEAQRELDEDPTIASIAQFRQSTAYLNTPLPFGAAFGPATTRQEVIEATESLYNNLMSSVPDRGILTFDLLALLAVQDNGEIDLSLMRNLIKLFRPDRDGNISLLDFAKSIDTCYKEMRILRASIFNSSKMDQAFEGFFNFFFYIVIMFIVLAVAGIDPFKLWASVSAFIASIAFIIGGGCAAYFQGLMMVFLRRPFDIGDRIATSQPYTDTSTTGSTTWVVKDMNLYSTTVIYSSTSEVATYSNGALSTLRIINATRSPQASLSFYLKFAIDTPFAKIQVFKTAIEKFIKARPREWVRFSCFRVYLVDAENGFVQYSVGGVHRESWHNTAALSNSKADLQAFATELSMQMGMRYEAPPMPVHLTLRNSNSDPAPTLDLPELDHQDLPAADSVVENQGLNTAQAVAALFGTELSPLRTLDP